MEDRTKSRHIGLVFPVLPPVPNGIGDYTGRIAKTFAKRGPCSVFAQAGEFEPIDGIPIACCKTDFDSPGGLIDLVEQNVPDVLLIQYNPFSYGRWGLNLTFPETLRRLRKRHPEMRLALMVHEAFVPTDSIKQTIMTVWQRYQLLRLGRVADIIFFSIEPWAKRFSRWFKGTTVIHAPVGSNIPRRGISQIEARKELGIDPNTFVVGAFGSNHESRLWDWVVDAAEAAGKTHNDPLFLYAGSAGDLLKGMVRSMPFQSLGRLPTKELSTAMSAMDLFLAPFREGISSRKGSAIIGLQHGIATLTSSGAQTDSFFHTSGMDLTDCDDKASYLLKAARAVREEAYRVTQAQCGLKLFSTTFEWDVVADVFHTAFDNEFGEPLVDADELLD